MIRFYNYPYLEILGGMFEIYNGFIPLNATLHGGFHAFYHKSGKLLIPGDELGYNPMTTFYKYVKNSAPCSILGTRYWFLSREEFRQFYRECRAIRRVNDKAWFGLSQFDRPGSESNIILRWKGNVEA